MGDKWVVRRKGKSDKALGLKFRPIRGKRVYSIVPIAEASHMDSKVEAMQRFAENQVDPAWWEVVKL